MANTSRPPQHWFEQTAAKVSEQLKKAGNSSLTPESLEKETREAVAEIWYSKMSEAQKAKILKEYECEVVERKSFESYQAMLAEIEAGLAARESLYKDYLSTTIAATAEEASAPALPIEAPKGKTTPSEVPLGDPMDKLTDSDQYGKIKTMGEEEKAAQVATATSTATVSASASVAEAASFSKSILHIPAYKMRYTAKPKFGSDAGEITLKAIVLEEGVNINGWKVRTSQFQRVAEAYKAGRQLRINHDKTVESVFGKSFNGVVLKGSDVAQYMGAQIEGINPSAQYVVAEFEASPQTPQVRTNILNGYVETGSIGLDAEAYCDACGKSCQIDSSTGDVRRSCRHNEAAIALDNVDVKEYSYVAEPAYPHAVMLPTFSAAVSSALKIGYSSLSVSDTQSDSSRTESMPQAPQPTENPKVAVEAKAEGSKKGEAEGEAEADAAAEALAKKYIAFYERGLAEGRKGAEAKASAESCPPGKSEASASVVTTKTDQIAKTNETSTAPSKSNDLMAKITNPTKYALTSDPAIAEIFKAAANHPDAPPEVRSRIRGVFA